MIPASKPKNKKTIFSTASISKALGIEGKKLLTADDDFQDLKHFNESYEEGRSAMELLELERDELLKADPLLKQRLDAMPRRAFSGREHISPAGIGVFLCYRLPVLREGEWDTEAGPCRWLFVTADGKSILEEPTQIVAFIRSTPETSRVLKLGATQLVDLRRIADAHLKTTYMKSLQIPPSVKPVLKAWMELN